MIYNVDRINKQLKGFLLEGPREAGTVEAVFPSVCLLQTRAGLLLALQNSNAVLSPMSILVPDVEAFTDLGLSAGETVRNCKSGNRLMLIIRDLCFDYSRRRFFDSCIPIKIQELPYSLYLAELEKYLQEGGAPLYQYLRGYQSGCGKGTAMEEMIGSRLKMASEQILEGMDAADDSKTILGLQGMLGLGPGLTPSGDDFFLGLATALYTSAKYAIILKRLKPLIRDLSGKATTRVSREFISYFFEGCYSQPVYDLVLALNNLDLPGFARILPEVGRFGHSSGRDYLSGLWRGLKFLGQKP